MTGLLENLPKTDRAEKTAAIPDRKHICKKRAEARRAWIFRKETAGGGGIAPSGVKALTA
ncbi:MAG: hypothetical protein DBY37_14575 [Desulfovibrionaceae bacterium]|nr:MAG: hypothetical protein DBY37_14575 [Desulfovibrionaceae bacterium]